MENLIIGCNGTVARIDPGTGKLAWKTSLKTGSLLSATSHEDVTVLLRGSIVFAGCAGHLFCLDGEDGKILWHNPLEGFGHNDVSLAMDGVSIQYLQKTQHTSS
ncbi:PQQ-binding-like beta-propeller repeat protein [Opitutus sp. ER46]|uniref:outer membrane protein assembly factor BamB family protein n=1 Tax=Opitutus sp. ER46 TaxID=2161864 RepID=UPI000D3021FA|nr:PQQ-binding-like beta-propeller repeat protein [Opitutus sp. ER46]PTX94600.1 hypothetical protein DB354_12780 [Opitutus sp. ER46]